MSRLAGIMKRSRGFSLVEMAIVTGIIAIGAMAGYSLLANVYGTRAGNVAALQAQQSARNIVERITRELRESSPEVVWLGYAGYEGESETISFFTPRDRNRRFMVDAEGVPVWQRGIAYWLNKSTNTMYRSQLYMVSDPSISYDSDPSFFPEEVSKNVEELIFSRDNDLITISVRTFVDPDGMGHTPKSYSEYRTTVKMRN